ncbi:MAG: bacteriohemerythrin [Candidatus Krumholzibacteriota bacterium]
MAFINWTEEFITGIPSIDEQHRRLVDLANKFEEAGRRGRGSRVMSDILNDLVGYTQEHFAHEEKIMAESGFPETKQHTARHRQLMQKVERFQYEFETEGRPVTADVREFLRYWVRSHILQDDMAYAAHLKQALVQS